MLQSAIATVSLGRASGGHGLIMKIQYAAAAGFAGIELFFECLESYACEVGGHDATPSRESLVAAARRVRDVCETFNMAIVCLQPFKDFEGLLDEGEREDKFTLLQFWIQLCQILGTDLIQIPTNFRLDGTTGDIERVVADLRAAARHGLQQSPPIRFAYEAVAWGAHFDLWEDTWTLVKEVNLPNFGLCLDVFHIAGRVWADPSASSGLNDDGDYQLKRSLEMLVRDVDPRKIFYVQLGDAERLATPIRPGHALFENGVNPRMLWSRNARLFPFEKGSGGYLPVEQISRAIFLDLGWKGWTSTEVFHKDSYQNDEALVSRQAERAMISWSRFKAFLEDAKRTCN